VVDTVAVVCIAALVGVFVWGRSYLLWRAGKPERSSAAFWKWK
jgi:hypothetical protein